MRDLLYVVQDEEVQDLLETLTLLSREARSPASTAETCGELGEAGEHKERLVRRIHAFMAEERGEGDADSGQKTGAEQFEHMSHDIHMHANDEKGTVTTEKARHNVNAANLRLLGWQRRADTRHVSTLSQFKTGVLDTLHDTGHNFANVAGKPAYDFETKLRTALRAERGGAVLHPLDLKVLRPLPRPEDDGGADVRLESSHAA